MSTLLKKLLDIKNELEDSESLTNSNFKTELAELLNDNKEFQNSLLIKYLSLKDTLKFLTFCESIETLGSESKLLLEFIDSYASEKTKNKIITRLIDNLVDIKNEISIDKKRDKFVYEMIIRYLPTSEAKTIDMSLLKDFLKYYEERRERGDIINISSLKEDFIKQNKKVVTKEKAKIELGNVIFEEEKEEEDEEEKEEEEDEDFDFDIEEDDDGGKLHYEEDTEIFRIPAEMKFKSVEGILQHYRDLEQQKYNKALFSWIIFTKDNKAVDENEEYISIVNFLISNRQVYTVFPLKDITKFKKYNDLFKKEDDRNSYSNVVFFNTKIGEYKPWETYLISSSDLLEKFDDNLFSKRTRIIDPDDIFIVDYIDNGNERRSTAFIDDTEPVKIDRTSKEDIYFKYVNQIKTTDKREGIFSTRAKSVGKSILLPLINKNANNSNLVNYINEKLYDKSSNLGRYALYLARLSVFFDNWNKNSVFVQRFKNFDYNPEELINNQPRNISMLVKEYSPEIKTLSKYEDIIDRMIESKLENICLELYSTIKDDRSIETPFFKSPNPPSISNKVYKRYIEKNPYVQQGIYEDSYKNKETEFTYDIKLRNFPFPDILEILEKELSKLEEGKVENDVATLWRQAAANIQMSDSSSESSYTYSSSDEE